MSDSSQPRGLQHTRLLCPSLSPGVCSDLCSLSWWCHPTISSFADRFPCCLQSFPASGPFPVIWLFTSGDQSLGASASVLPMTIHSWFPLRLTGLISLKSKGLSRVFCSITIWKHPSRFYWDKIIYPWSFLAVQWLGLDTFTVMAPCSVPGWWTKIPSAAWHSQE